MVDVVVVGPVVVLVDVVMLGHTGEHCRSHSMKIEGEINLQMCKLDLKA